MKIEVFANPDAAARAAAQIVAAEARKAVAERGRFVVAFSGSETPRPMLRALAGEDVPWDSVHIVQVDERVAPAGDSARNLTLLKEALLDRAPVPPDHVHAMPVEEGDLDAAAERYALTLQRIARAPAVLDFVHLGLGPDGHTASLVPGSPALEIGNADVAVTGVYQGHRRMTMTYPILNRARRILWLVSGGGKAGMLARLCRADPSIPAGRVRQDDALIVADEAAAAQLGGGAGSAAKK
jgi:6-phosphogluconolactonase